MIFNRIQELCKQHCVSIAKLERECGLGNATIRGWKKSTPSVECLKKVANYFNVSVDYFITGEEI